MPYYTVHTEQWAKEVQSQLDVILGNQSQCALELALFTFSDTHSVPLLIF